MSTRPYYYTSFVTDQPMKDIRQLFVYYLMCCFFTTTLRCDWILLRLFTSGTSYSIIIRTVVPYCYMVFPKRKESFFLLHDENIPLMNSFLIEKFFHARKMLFILLLTIFPVVYCLCFL